jgi:hypothetical protein
LIDAISHRFIVYWEWVRPCERAEKLQLSRRGPFEVREKKKNKKKK